MWPTGEPNLHRTCYAVRSFTATPIVLFANVGLAARHTTLTSEN